MTIHSLFCKSTFYSDPVLNTYSLFSCRLVTFYFLHKFTGESPLPDCRQPSTASTRLLPQTEEDAADLIDKYGSYLDIYKCLVLAGKLHSKVLVDKLVSVSKHDSQHQEAVKTLRTKSLLFYEPVSN